MTVLLLRSISWCFALIIAFDQPNIFFRLLPKYGYFAILIAAFLEGEATLIAAGFRISIPLVCATAGMPAKKYSTLNLISGFAWASMWVAISYQVGAHV